MAGTERDAGPRIASLVPSSTELLCALGLAPFLVARTGFCIHPKALLQNVPKVGGTKDVNLARLAALRPTHVLMNEEENRLDTHAAISLWPGVQCLVSFPRAPSEVPALVAELATAFGDQAGVREHAARLQAELQTALAQPVPAPTRSLLYLIWREPWMLAGADTYIARLLAQAGWRLEAPDTARYPALAATDPLWQAVDEVWLSSEPYRFGAQQVAEVQSLAPQARVRLVDGELCSWWGARTAAGLTYLRCLHSTENPPPWNSTNP
jgi:ABC-type Fe3+-hydroxamate transport system substrate-binding protein